MVRLVQEDPSEHRSSERITLNLDAKFSLDGGVQCFCVIRDFCDGGLFFTFSGVDPNFKKIKEEGIERGRRVCLEFYHRKKLVKMETTFVRLLENAMAVRFPVKNPPELAVFLEVAKHYQHLRDNAKGIQITNIEYQKALVKAENLVSDFLEPLMNSFLLNVDQAMIDEAARAANDTEATDIMDAAASIKRNQQSIKHNYRRDLTNGVVALTRGAEHTQPAEDKMSISTDQLSIVDKEEFEDWLIIKVMVTKAEQKYRDLLLELQLRIDSLTGNKTPRVDNPIAPPAIANQFRDIVRSLNLTAKLEKTVYKQFELEVLAKLEPLYIEINNLLIDYGILPDLVLSQYLSKDRHKKEAKKEQEKKQDQQKASANGASPAEQSQAPADQQANQDSSSSAPSPTGQPVNNAPGASQQKSALAEQNAANLENAKNVLHATQELLKLRRERKQGEATPEASTPTAGAGDQSSVQHNNPQNNPLNNPSEALAAAQQTLADLEQGSNTQSKEQIAKSIREVIGDLQRDLDRYYQLINEFQHEGSRDRDYPGMLRSLLTSQTPASPGGQLFTDEEDEAIEVVDGLISSILSNETVVNEIKPYLNKLRLPLFKLLLQDTDFLTTEKHPARRMINQMAGLGVEEGHFTDDIKSLLADGVHSILEDQESGTEVYSDFLQKLEGVAQKQEKIYQRNLSRVTEVYEGQEKLAQAKEQVASELDFRFKGNDIPVVVKDLLDKGWKDLMRLSLLRQGEDSKPWKMSLDVLDHLKHYLNTDETEQNGNESADLKLDAATLLTVIKTGLQRVDTINDCEPLIKELEKYLAFEGKVKPRTTKYQILSEEKKLETEMAESDDGGAWSPKQELQKWVKRAQRLQVGDWVRFFESSDDKEGKRVRLAWVAKNKTRFVFVNRQGVKYCDLTIRAFANRLMEGRANLLGEEDVAIVDQGLEAMVQKIYEQLAYESTHDQLTNLFNRKEFERRVQHALRSAKKDDRKHVIGYIDLSQFQVVNSSSGLSAGDALLKKVAKILQKTAPKDSVIARLSGNEFGVLLMNTPEEKGYTIIDAQMQAIKSIRFQWEESLYRIGASIGLLEISEDSYNVQHLLQSVEACCISAKEAGGDRIITYQPDNNELARRESVMEWVTKVNTALEEDRLRLRMQRIQPISANASESQLPHYEILLSALDEKGESITPIEFVRAAERYNRMQVVDQWVIKTVFNWMQENRGPLDSLGGISINLSGHSINDDRLMKFIFEEFTDKSVPRDKLCFEITETTAVTHLSDAADFIKEMKKVGCRFALDDFGTGMSSYTYLKHLPVDFVKIDGAFIKHIATDEMDFAMVRSMNEMAHCMGKKTVAEFVADEAILDRLKEIGVDFAQGYYIEEPLWLDEWRPEAQNESD